jgi:hypothetical protein
VARREKRILAPRRREKWSAGQTWFGASLEEPFRPEHLGGAIHRVLGEIHAPVVIDWGFPPDHLNAVRKLFDGGVMLWWFAADWTVARRKFEQRGYPFVQDFDIQIRKIKATLPEINALFGSHLEYALPSTGIYIPPDKIWDSILDTLAGPRKMLGLPAPVHLHPSLKKK